MYTDEGCFQGILSPTRRKRATYPDKFKMNESVPFYGIFGNNYRIFRI